jgi:hypothetical protein
VLLIIRVMLETALFFHPAHAVVSIKLHVFFSFNKDQFKN